MCRSKLEGGRRCPHDTSSARLKRYHNQQLRERAAGITLQPPREISEIDVPSSPLEDFQQAREKLDEVLSQKHYTHDYYEKVALACVQVGAAVRELAFDGPVPSPEEFAAEIARKDVEWQSAIDKAQKASDEALHLTKAKIEEYSGPDGELDGRWLWRADNREEYNTLTSNLSSTGAELSRIQGAYRRERPEQIRQYLKVRAQQYKEALSQVGVEFYDPETSEALKTHRTTKQAAELMSEALTFVPQSWVDASNRWAEKTPLRVWESKRRSHYSHHKNTKQFKVISETWVVEQDDHWEPKPGTVAELEYTKVPPKNAASQYAVKGELTEPGFWYFTRHETYRQYPADDRSPWRSKDEPRGRGWIATGPDEDGVVTWARPVSQRRTVGNIQEAEITLPPAEIGDYSRSVALHEFSHRSEMTVRDMSNLEQSFLRYRTQRQAPQWLGKGYRKDEVAKPDNFPSPYMGKIYGGDKYTEIASMGMEALFFGRNGGFVGDKADPEYESFMLGLLAYTGTADKK